MGSDTACSRGAFILFEGGDRCGKSTQCKLLVEHLSASGVRNAGNAYAAYEPSPQSRSQHVSARCIPRESLRAAQTPVELWSFPDRTTAVGRMIDAYLSSKAELDDAAIHLLFSANRWEKQ